MANSTRYNLLETRLEQLRANFLPASFDSIGSYEPAVYDRATAYRLMVHSEFESFAEDIVKVTVDEALAAWRTGKKVTLPIVCIVASYEGAEKINAFPKDQNKRPPTVNTFINKCHSHFEHNIGNNNGIRTSNLLALLIQAGVEEADLDATWIGSLDAFGAHRNIVGHNSNVVAYQADPKTAMNAAESIRDGFKELDAKLIELRASF